MLKSGKVKKMFTLKPMALKQFIFMWINDLSLPIVINFFQLIIKVKNEVIECQPSFLLGKFKVQQQHIQYSSVHTWVELWNAS